jgi:hypothetical protein
MKAAEIFDDRIASGRAQYATDGQQRFARLI